MAIVGHFKDLAEARKLVQSTLLANVVQEIYEEGQLLRRLPVMTIDSRSIIYNREKTLPSGSFFDIHEQLSWTADVEYTAQVECWLKRVYRQDILDKFMMKTYKSPNDYRSIILSQLRKGCMRTIEDKLIYGASTTAGTPLETDMEFPGINELVFANSGQLIDQGGETYGLSITNLLDVIDLVKPRPDMLLMTRTLRNKLTEHIFSKGGTGTGLAYITITKDEFGKPLEMFNGVPIAISDYLNDNCLDNAGTKSTGTDLSCIYAIRFGQIEDGGLCLCTGGDTGGVDFFQMIELDNLEDYDASGIRLVAYLTLALGSTKALACIHSIAQDEAIGTEPG